MITIDRKWISRVCCGALIFTCLTPVALANNTTPTRNPSGTTNAATTMQGDDRVPVGQQEGNSKGLTIKQDDIKSAGAVLINAQNGKVLFAKNANELLYPASTTKIITCLLAIEKGNLDDKVTVGKEVKGLPGDSSKIPISQGEVLTLRDLLYGLMLVSGNDGAMAVAAHIGGTVPDFVEMMNQRAAQMGCTNTHFANPHGYHDKEHYTTASDLAKIAYVAMKNPMFREIVGTANYTIPATNKHEKENKLKNANKFVRRIENDSNSYAFGIGVKTGYTSAAGQCFVGAAQKDGIELISVGLKAPKQDDKWIDSIAMLEYGFSQFVPYTVEALYEQSPEVIKLGNAAPDDIQAGELTLSLRAQGDVPKMMDSQEAIDRMAADFSSLIQIDYTREALAPVIAGEVFGTLTFTSEGGTPLVFDLIASRDVAHDPAIKPTDAPKSVDEIAKETEDGSLDIPWLRIVLIVLGVLVAAFVLLVVFAQITRRKRRSRIMRRRQRS